MECSKANCKEDAAMRVMFLKSEWEDEHTMHLCMHDYGVLIRFLSGSQTEVDVRQIK